MAEVKNKAASAGYVALPEAGEGPGVLVVHGWWGLSEATEAFCRRLAEAGFVAFAPDLYDGESATNIPEAKKLRAKANKRVRAALPAAVARLGELPLTRPEFGAVGFSWGAHWALWLSLEQPRVRAVTVFYGSRNDDYARAQAAYLGHFAERDAYLAASGVKKLERNLKAASRPAQLFTYPGTGHWFFERDRPDAFSPEAAELAWQRTVAFLRAQLQKAEDADGRTFA